MTTRRNVLKNGAAIIATLSHPALFSITSVASPTTDVLVYSGDAFGSRWHLSLSERDSPIVAIKTITDVVEDIDLAMSPYRPESELVHFNNHTKG